MTGPGRVFHRAEPTMGTVVTFDVVLGSHEPDAALFLALARARAILHRADATFSLWRPNSPMSRLRRGELESFEAPAEIVAVLERCELARELSGGFFDAHSLPGGLDPTGLVKGWAAQQALREIVDAGFCDAMLNAGGDIATAGEPAGGGPWRIGIRHPASGAHLAAVVEVRGAIATSGTYERGAHLFDPFAQCHRAALASASVTGEELDLADALATALAVEGEAGLERIEALEGYEALAVLADGSVRATSGLRQLEMVPLALGA
jgi:FAD:protein FMN transferase